MATLLQKNSIAQNDTKYLHQVGISDSLFSNVLKESRIFYVQLPDGYDPNSNQTYPVVYVLDGDVLLPAVSTVYDFYYGGFLPEMILIGISNSNHRTRDLTTSEVKSRFGMPYNEENGQASVFLKFIETELIPYVEKNYLTTSYRTLIGHSYGGLFAIHTLLHHSELFASYLAIDPSLDWDNQKLFREARDILDAEDYHGKSLFISLGGQLHMQKPEVTIDNVLQDSSDYTLFARSNILFSNLVRQHTENGLAFSWKFYPRDLHGTIPLPSVLDGLISLFDWFQMEKTDRFNSFDTSQEELYKIVKYREKKLQDHFGYRVPPYGQDLLNMLGYMNMDMGNAEKAKMFFQFAIEYFPQNANVYDSMADYYESQNDYNNAYKNVSKAFELSGNNYYKERMDGLKSKK
jgi:predicted alpha/beta superfamily hydrolase